MSRMRVLDVFAAMVLLGALVSPAQAQSTEPEVQEIGLLFSHTAERGSLRPTGSEGSFSLTLHDVARQVVWFSDRPARHSGHIPVRGFVRAWDGFGFVEDPPNAALTLLAVDHDRDTVVLELTQPRYLKKTRGVRYSATMLGEATGNLDHLENSRDRRVPRRFRAASLFIDDANGQVINGCLIQPRAWCAEADLSGVDLSRADLSSAILDEADLDEADLSGATLTNATLTNATLTNATLTGANLSGANLSGAWLYGTDLSRADLTGANLSGAYLSGANLSGADLSGANLSYAYLDGADLTGAYICRTIWTDGTENNRDC